MIRKPLGRDQPAYRRQFAGLHVFPKLMKNIPLGHLHLARCFSVFEIDLRQFTVGRIARVGAKCPLMQAAHTQSVLRVRPEFFTLGPRNDVAGTEKATQVDIAHAASARVACQHGIPKEPLHQPNSCYGAPLGRANLDGNVDWNEVIGKPLFVYWSYENPEPYVPVEKSLREMADDYLLVAMHFFDRTRWFRFGTMIQ